jgi:hypothetical protein
MNHLDRLDLLRFFWDWLHEPWRNVKLYRFTIAPGVPEDPWSLWEDLGGES